MFSDGGWPIIDRDERIGYLYMGLAVFMFSTSSIFVRWSIPPLHPLTVTALRMLFGSLAVILTSLVLKRSWKPPARRQYKQYIFYGLVAAAHFGFYIASLSFTTIAHSLSITYTSPIWVTLFAWLFLGEPFPRRKWPGVMLTVAGIAILAGFEAVMDSRMLIGDLLALGSAICFGLYSVAGRSQREKASLFTYAASVYGLAALWLALPGIWFYKPGSFTVQAGLAVLGASVFPLAIGHTLYNATLRRLSPTIANILATQEVTGGVLLGILLLGEVPSPGTIVGGLLALAGVIWTLL
ncbi:MAG: DMT family transporter [Anaerolineales bacterium]|nr:DMT family transporter [Anaerolineales bacterium]